MAVDRHPPFSFKEQYFRGDSDSRSLVELLHARRRRSQTSDNLESGCRSILFIPLLEFLNSHFLSSHRGLMYPVLCRLPFGVAFALILTAQISGLAQQGVISPQEHARRANEFLKANQPAKAIPEFAALVAVEPDNLDAQANLGVLLYFQARPSEALEHLRKAVQLNPNLPRIQALLGLCEY